MTLKDLLRESANTTIILQSADGSFPPGHNGPYHDPETPARNTAHWLVTLAHINHNESSDEIISAAHRACDYLLSSAARPMNASFFCRTNPKKDFCNGLMGQAWAIEGLIAASRLLDRKDALQLAQEVFHLHPFSKDDALWQRVAVDGSYLPPDATFNHQLWFAAIAAQLQDTEATQRAGHFLDQIGQHVQLYPNGIIFHKSKLGPVKPAHFNSVMALARATYAALRRMKERRQLYSKSVGYHGFNLYAFAMLKQQFPDHPFWTSKKINKMLAVTQTDAFLKDLDHSHYGWPYNPPGLELAFAGEVFNLGHEYCQFWINRQYEKTYDANIQNLLTRDTPDPQTSSARLYEATRLTGQYELPTPP